MFVAVSGKGGVGKTSLAALILDELARHNDPGRILAVDGDPAMTLHLALGIDQPGATVGTVRDSVKLDGRTLRSLPAGTSPGQYLLGQLRWQNVVTRHRLRDLSFDFLAMGPGEGPGCYCAINGALKQALAAIVGHYDVVVLDDEAGLEHINRYRMEQVDLFLVVAGPDLTSQEVAARIIETAGQMSIEIGETWVIYNRVMERLASDGFRLSPVHRFNGHQAIVVPYSWGITPLEIYDQQPVVRLPQNDAMRPALAPIVERIVQCA
jgi:CO dehydrogenase maturation factor